MHVSVMWFHVCQSRGRICQSHDYMRQSVHVTLVGTDRNHRPSSEGWLLHCQGERVDWGWWGAGSGGPRWSCRQLCVEPRCLDVGLA